MGAREEGERMDIDERSPPRKDDKREKSSHRSKEKSSKEHKDSKSKHKSKDKERDRDAKHHSSRDKPREKEKVNDRDAKRSSRREEGEAEEARPSGRSADARRSAERDAAASNGTAATAADPAREESPLPGDVAAPQPEQPAPAAPVAPAAGELPLGATPQVMESGGEVSMSTEETNKMRIAMGLKPLTADGGSKSREDKERAAGKERRDAEAKKASEAELRQRISSAKEKRKMETDLAKTKTLGVAEADVDDISAWVSKSRESEAEAKRAAERAAAAKMASMYDEEDEEASDDEEKEAATPAEMAGMRIKHSAEELGEGETAILTLADRNILEEGSEEEEVLENVLSAQDKQRAKARKAALKPGAAEYDEDGRPKGLLSKYDEEEEEGGLRIGAAGVVADAKSRQQAEIRRRLAEGDSLDASAAPAAMGGAREYYTKEEMETFKPKKRLKKKLRKARAAAMDDDEEGLGAGAGPSSTADAVAALEEAAAAEAEKSGVRDHGSRSHGAARDTERAAKEADEAKKKRDRYEAALKKANYKTLAASMADTGGAGGGGGADEEDEDDMRAQLEISMRRSRATQKKEGADPVAAAIIARREAEESAQPSDAGAPAGERLTEATEFARLVGQRDESVAEVGDGDGAGGHMDVDADLSAAPEAKPAVNGTSRSYRSSRQSGSDAAPMETDGSGGAEKLPPPPAGGPPVKKEEEDLFTRERAAGVGVAGVLELMRSRGELTKKQDLQKMEWAGRTNDMKPVALQGLEAVFTGERDSDYHANVVERALTRRDEHGRVFTPKENWRQLCHDFHGIYPSKNKQQRQLDKDAEAVKRKQAATSQATAGMRRLQATQQETATPYVVLSGKVAPGQTSDPASGYATASGYQTGGAASLAPTPMLSGGQTPLTGDRKVAAMLGMKRKGDASMPPPMRKQQKG